MHAYPPARVNDARRSTASAPFTECRAPAVTDRPRVATLAKRQGFAINVPADMAHRPPALRADRKSVILRAEIFRMGEAEPTLHRVLNLSATGLCIAAPAGLTPKAAVVVSIGQVEQVSADTVWVRNGTAGLRFHEPVDLAAARKPRSGGARPAPAAGWLAELNSPYDRGPARGAATSRS